MKAQGWYRDPYHVHDDRYFSDGQPTKLVRDGEAESYDPPPPGLPQVELVEAPRNQAGNGSDLRRADDRQTSKAAYDAKSAFWAVLDSVAAYGPVN